MMGWNPVSRISEPLRHNFAKGQRKRSPLRKQSGSAGAPEERGCTVGVDLAPWAGLLVPGKPTGHPLGGALSFPSQCRAGWLSALTFRHHHPIMQKCRDYFPTDIHRELSGLRKTHIFTKPPHSIPFLISFFTLTKSPYFLLSPILSWAAK